ncbi:MAG: LysR family transcriptional regulator [Eubacteriales bacterium]|nr:LysR family transcriptional regulator [Eubacteriales bacterium]
MNLNQLEYFVAAAETLNFTRAASRCFISQTAMTQQIRALEKIVGAPLFIRDKHHVELTISGKVFLKEAQFILERSNEALRMARLASEGESGELTIGYIRGYGQSDFAEILRSFTYTFPNIKLNLISGNSSDLLEHLEKKECDMVFSISPFRKDNLNFHRKYVRSYPVMGVLYTDHPLASRDHLTYEDLKEEDFIMMQPSNRPKDQMEESMLIYERGGYLPNVVRVEGNQESLILMIAAGMGISLLPEYITRPYIKSQFLRILPILKQDGSAETLDFDVIWRKEQDNPAVEQLVEMLS